MPRLKHRFRMYQRLVAEGAAILEEAREAARELGLAPEPAGPPGKPEDGGDGRDKGLRRPVETTLDRIREVVKNAYGDEYDCCATSSPASALWLACQAAFAPGPPPSRPALAYVRPRCIVPRQKNLAVPGASNLLPPKYRYLLDRAAGPTPSLSPVQDDFEAVIVPLEGAVYGNHGPSYSAVSLLAGVKPESSLDVLSAAAEVHAPFLSGLFYEGTSTPGCGFGPRDEEGVHLLQKGIGELAAEFDVPRVTHEAFGLPFLGGKTRERCSSATVYGHPAMGGLGLIIGTEDLVTPLLREAVHPPAPGSAPVTVPPEESGISALSISPDSLLALLDLVTDLAADPDRYKRPLNRLYEVVTAELADLDPELENALRVRKETSSLSVEINYEDTWRDGPGFPIFSAKDSRNGTNLLELGIAAMGISTASVLEASITVHLPNPGLGRFDLDEERTRMDLKGLVRLMQIVGKRSGFLG